MSLIIPHNYTVDIANGTASKKITTPMVRGDGSTHKVTVALLDGGVAADTTGYDATLYAVRSGDRVTVINDSTIVGNVVTALLRADSLRVNGRVDLVLSLTKAGSNTITPIGIEAECTGGLTDTFSDPENIIPSLAELLAQIADCEAATDAANDAADAITGITAEAETLAAGSSATAVAETDPEDEHINLVFGIPRGDKGDTGASITSASFVDDDLVFTKDDSSTVTIEDAKIDLKGDKGDTGDPIGVHEGVAITGTSTTPTAYATGITLSAIDDIYIYNGTDSANVGNEYICTLGGDESTALWKYLRNVRGVPGEGNVSFVDSITPDVDGNVLLSAMRHVAMTLTATQRRVAAQNMLGTYGGTVVADPNTIDFSGFYTCYQEGASVTIEGVTTTTIHAPFTTESAFILHINSNVGVVSAFQLAMGYTTGSIKYNAKRTSAWAGWSSDMGAILGISDAGSYYTTDTVSAALQQIGARLAGIWIEKTATLLASGWSASAPFTQTVAVTGLLATDTPIVDVVLSDTEATARDQLDAYRKIARIDTGANEITATCYDLKPTVDIPVILKVVR